MTRKIVKPRVLDKHILFSCDCSTSPKVICSAQVAKYELMYNLIIRKQQIKLITKLCECIAIVHLTDLLQMLIYFTKRTWLTVTMKGARRSSDL